MKTFTGVKGISSQSRSDGALWGKSTAPLKKKRFVVVGWKDGRKVTLGESTTKTLARMYADMWNRHAQVTSCWVEDRENENAVFYRPKGQKDPNVDPNIRGGK